ncbi:TPA: glycosyltransferase family 2 protein [Streptococcus pneumoniae]|uniref:glycosyltransferase n=1 Tax=Streptococcus pneumoniae TaxID=1313 RepID=UPI0005E32B4C|nr:glycosyltransferase family 2 protein [Streptococcus pneumoniae]MBW7535418.1 glycosyltransferase family 2 protein [Streptococcus pneumoniae]MDG7853979.1 glycosyltransferase family 2 protein [Streptococcus pneumoniae]MDG8429186.1 glycosyltransferase family 2 protein [Streptococcus pneumoniae]MDS2269453.1 glycosyltransferase family 2 protein [Streptococcus pneumoniae]MDS3125194.1 glycosyltransferase family 2 protein [Streptococcus pneumoniae]
MNKKIGIVILNYLNWEDTLECINSLRSQSDQDFEAVIVENGSPNESVSRIRDYIKNDKNIHICVVDNNLGYANGNNMGILYLKNRYSINRILLTNNDVVFDDEDYIKKLEDIKYSNTIGAIGTKIIGSDGLDQNPAYFPISFKSSIKLLIINLLAFSKAFTFIKRRYLSSWAKKVNDFSAPRYNNQKYCLHGSVIFLTENYLDKFMGLYGGTFLYYEEVILGIIFEKAGLDMLYIPNFSIYHKEDQSSLQSFNNDDLVRRRYLLQSIWSSMRIYRSSIDNLSNIIENSIKEKL